MGQAKRFKSIRWKQGNLQGEIKAAEPADNPGELIVIMMPIIREGQEDRKGWHRVYCPICQIPCWATTQFPEAAKMYAGRVVATCTHCGLTANQNKGSLPRMLKRRGITPESIVLPILDLFKDGESHASK